MCDHNHEQTFFEELSTFGSHLKFENVFQRTKLAPKSFYDSKSRDRDFYSIWDNRRQDGRTPGAFIRLAKKTWYDMPQVLVQNGIEKQRELFRNAYSSKRQPPF